MKRGLRRIGIKCKSFNNIEKNSTIVKQTIKLDKTQL